MPKQPLQTYANARLDEQKKGTGVAHGRMISTCAWLLVSSLACAQQATTAWKDGRFHVDRPGVFSRGNIVLGQPNSKPEQAMQLGNGVLGIAVWSGNGLTAQLNRSDTMPYRNSPGQIVLPGLSTLTSAQDYKGGLDLYSGTFEESGGGMSLRAYVQPGHDTLVLDITGADPSRPQTAILKLWPPRAPQASASGAIGMLMESWKDDTQPGASGRTFGSLAAITAEGRNVSAVVTDQRTITITFLPNKDGRFRIVVAAPHYAGGETAEAHHSVAEALADRDPHTHTAWWQSFWERATPIKITSADGSGEYLENLRDIYLYAAAAEGRGDWPSSQAGIADLFSSVGDEHMWDPAAFWHFNLRMQVGANLGANVAELNLPYFKLYRDNLQTMEEWTKEHMKGAPGICVPETVRFNGKGIEFETWGGNTKNVSGWNCDAASPPYYNARTISTGAEVSLWIWRQYLATDDIAFLRANYPVMVAAARFLLSYEKPGADGLLHTSPSNAHETQWDVKDPTTDLAARQALFAALIQASNTLHQDPELVKKLQHELTLIPPLPRTLPVPPVAPTTLPSPAGVLLTASSDAQGKDVIANSYKPSAPIRNMENIGLEPVWPYSTIGDTSLLFDLARRTYRMRANVNTIDWSFDPIDAARLGFGEDVRQNLIDTTEMTQKYINGFADWGAKIHEFYIEQIGVTTLALQEALVQDYDGTIRIAPAVPKQWDMEGSVAVRGLTIVDVQTHDGVATTVGLVVKHAQKISIRNPWPDVQARIVNARTGTNIMAATNQKVIEFAAMADTTYRLEPVPQTPLPFAPITGEAPTTFRKLGPVQIGLP